jgi:hypothetical protein
LSRRGEVLVLVGDSATQAWMEIGTDFDHQSWIDALVRRGINTAMLWTYIGSSGERRRSDSRIGYDAPAQWPWCGTLTDGNIDLSCFNEAYFHRLRDLVAYAESHGVIVVLTVHDGWIKERFDSHPFNAEFGNGPLQQGKLYVELAHYGREMPVDLDSDWSRAERNQYFQERFSARLIETLEGHGNVIYEMFNEGEWYDRRHRLLHELHFLAFFRARTRALLASNFDHIDGIDRGAPVDIVSLHRPLWSEEIRAREVFAHYASETSREPVTPVLFSETVPEWEGNLEEVDALTRLTWGALLGGGQVVLQNDTNFPFASQTGVGERASENEILLDRLGHAARFATAVNLESMRPDPGLCSTRVCTANLGVEYVVYSEETDEFWVDLADVPAGRVRAHWHDPRTGRMEVGELVEPVRRVRFNPPYADAVLHLRTLD